MKKLDERQAGMHPVQLLEARRDTLRDERWRWTQKIEQAMARGGDCRPYRTELQLVNARITLLSDLIAELEEERS